MKKSITIAAAALLSIGAAGAVSAAPGDREYYPGASRQMNVERGADVYGAPPAAVDGDLDTMSTGSIYRDGSVTATPVYGDGAVNKSYAPGEGDYYEGVTPR